VFDVKCATAEEIERGSGWSISIVAPAYAAQQVVVITGGKANDVSAVVQVRYGGRDVLVCGDAPAATLNGLAVNGHVSNVALLVAPHHGGRIGNRSKTAGAYSALTPESVVFSAGPPTKLCSDHVGAVANNAQSLMCTGGVAACGLTRSCAGQVFARVLGSGRLLLSPTVNYHRRSVLKYKHRSCVGINK
jgi:hypothetical protein